MKRIYYILLATVALASCTAQPVRAISPSPTGRALFTASFVSHNIDEWMWTDGARPR